MRISERKRNELYSAIHDSITDLRIKLKLPGGSDFALAQLEQEIWRRIKSTMKLPNL